MSEEYIELKGIQHDQRKEKIKQFGRSVASGISNTISKLKEMKEKSDIRKQERQEKELQNLKSKHEYLIQKHKVKQMEDKIRQLEKKNMPKFESGFGSNLFSMPFENKKKEKEKQLLPF